MNFSLNLFREHNNRLATPRTNARRLGLRRSTDTSLFLFGGRLPRQTRRGDPARKQTFGMIRFSIAFALLVKADFLVVTFAGHATLWMVILADTGAAPLMIVNSLRLLSGDRTSTRRSS